MRYVVVLIVSLLAAGCGKQAADPVAPTSTSTSTAPAQPALAADAPWKAVHFFADGQPDDLAEWNVLRVAGGRLQLNADVLPYDLNTALFSDYAHKLRTVWMPKGQGARYQAEQAFDFPIGTVLSKTFYYPRGQGEAVLRSADDGADLSGGGLDLSRVRLIETRLLLRRDSGWVALPYVWNAEQTRARLMRGGELISLDLVGGDGKRETADYQVPDQNQCAGCHGTDMKTKALHPLGPKARHLNRDFAYADGLSNQIARWTRAGYLQGAPQPQAAPRDANWRDAAAPLEARARAYLDINCGHCHSPTGPGNTSGLWLDAATREPMRLGRCKRPIAAGKGTGDLRHDVVPGKPDESILTFRMLSDDPSVMMPELGRSVVHEEGVKLIRDWIAAQRGGCE
ncbi:SO2930 family diheme c-type cytochrome [Lysobacter sp. CA199]|uniref:SO2930 family diheme c-type cytochrome n=1 Tax=Lysobacter sp. CA199 TaxID=3455608 RepID=UPI003F8D340E